MPHSMTKIVAPTNAVILPVVLLDGRGKMATSARICTKGKNVPTAGTKLFIKLQRLKPVNMSGAAELVITA